MKVNEQEVMDVGDRLDYDYKNLYPIPEPIPNCATDIHL